MDGHDLAAHAHHETEGEHNKSGERRTRWVVALTAVMMVGELIVAWRTGSMALRADGWHMGTHVLALGLAVVAYWYARTRAGKDTFSFGTGKVYALAGFTSAVVLAMVALWMFKEGVEQLLAHPPVKYGEAIPVAALGFVVNLVSAMLLGHSHTYGPDHDHDHDHDHEHHHHDAEEADPDEPPKPGTLDFNLRAAWVHIVADASTSLLAIGALCAGKYAGLWYFDPAMGLVGGVVIAWWAVSLCLQTARQLLDVVSSPTCERVVRERLEAIDDVRVADLRVWDLGPGRRSCIVSIVTARPREIDEYRHAVLGALEVAHLTIEIHRCDLPHRDADDVVHAHAH
jgi:cation diffusion facilitator family transporter